MKLSAIKSSEIQNTTLVYSALVSNQVPTDLAAKYILGKATEEQSAAVLKQVRAGLRSALEGVVEQARAECAALNVTDASALAAVLLVEDKNVAVRLIKDIHQQDALLAKVGDGDFGTVFSRLDDLFKTISPDSYLADRNILQLFKNQFQLLKGNDEYALMAQAKREAKWSHFKENLSDYIRDLCWSSHSLTADNLLKVSDGAYQGIDTQGITAVSLLDSKIIAGGVDQWKNGVDLSAILKQWMIFLPQFSTEYAVLAELKERAETLPKEDGAGQGRLHFDFEKVVARVRTLLKQSESLETRFNNIPDSRTLSSHRELKNLFDTYQVLLEDLMVAVEGSRDDYIDVAREMVMLRFHKEKFGSYLGESHAHLIFGRLNNFLDGGLTGLEQQKQDTAWLDKRVAGGSVSKREWVQAMIQNPKSAISQAQDLFHFDNYLSVDLSMFYGNFGRAEKELGTADYDAVARSCKSSVSSALGTVLNRG